MTFPSPQDDNMEVTATCQLVAHVPSGISWYGNKLAVLQRSHLQVWVPMSNCIFNVCVSFTQTGLLNKIVHLL
jgi:hypothetical protein